MKENKKSYQKFYKKLLKKHYKYSIAIKNISNNDIDIPNYLYERLSYYNGYLKMCFDEYLDIFGNDIFEDIRNNKK